MENLDLKQLLDNTETFHKLGDFDNEFKTLAVITQNYPQDYSGWWDVAQLIIDRRVNLAYEWDIIGENVNKYRLGNSYTIRKVCFQEDWTTYSALFRPNDIKEAGFKHIKLKDSIANSITLAPPEKVPEIRKKAKEWYLFAISLYNTELERLACALPVFESNLLQDKDIKKEMAKEQKSISKSLLSIFSNNVYHNIDWYYDNAIAQKTINNSYSFDCTHYSERASSSQFHENTRDICLWQIKACQDEINKIKNIIRELEL